MRDLSACARFRRIHASAMDPLAGEEELFFNFHYEHCDSCAEHVERDTCTSLLGMLCEIVVRRNPELEDLLEPELA
jgi:hypothetical protein